MSDGNGLALREILLDNPKVVLAAIVDDSGNLQLIANGNDIQKLCTAYYLLAKNVDAQIMKTMQQQKTIVQAPASVLDRLK